MDARIERELDFHNRRFENYQTRIRGQLRQAALHDITIYALNQTFDEAKRYCRGADVLDFGCAEGEASFILQRAGAKSVTGIDLSDVAIAKAQAQAAREGLDNLQFRTMNAEQLDLPSQSFDLVFGIGILHHLDLKRASAEIRRVMRPGGKAVFMEPLALNPAIKLFRRVTPSMRTADEHPLNTWDLDEFIGDFNQVSCVYTNLTSLFTIPLFWMPGVRALRWACHAVDRAVFSVVPFCRAWAWNVVITLAGPRPVA